MTSAETIAELALRFTEWKDQILRLAERELSAKEILAILESEMQPHVQSSNGHSLTAAQVGVFTRSEALTLRNKYFPTRGIPVTKVHAPTLTIVGRDITVPTFTVSYLGRVLTVPGVVLQMVGDERQYLKVSVSNTPTPFTCSVLLTAGSAEDTSTMIIGTVDVLDPTTLLYTPLDVVRIGAATISTVARGNGIPASPGTPDQIGSIDVNWPFG